MVNSSLQWRCVGHPSALYAEVSPSNIRMGHEERRGEGDMEMDRAIEREGGTSLCAGGTERSASIRLQLC